MILTSDDKTRRCFVLALATAGVLLAATAVRTERPVRLERPKLAAAVPQIGTGSPAETIRIRGTGAAFGRGPLTLRLRDLDLVDVFHVLHEITSQSFVLDADVTGRVSLELAEVSLDGALEALRASGISVSPPGPLRRVSPAARGAATPYPAGQGEPLDLAVKRGDVRDLFRLLSEIGGVEIVERLSGDLARVTIFASERPWDEALSAVLDAAGLQARRDDNGRLLVERDPASPISLSALPPSKSVLNPVAHLRNSGQSPFYYAPDILHCTPVDELELAGLVRQGAQWRAVVHAPGYLSRALYLLVPGARLCDGAVESVDAEGVSFLRDQGTVLRVLLPLL